MAQGNIIPNIALNYGRITHNTYGFARYYKQGDIVTVEVQPANISNTEWHNIGYLPEGFRPIYAVYNTGWVRDGNTMILYIDTDGSISVIGSSNAGTSLTFSARSF